MPAHLEQALASIPDVARAQTHAAGAVLYGAGSTEETVGTGASPLPVAASGLDADAGAALASVVASVTDPLIEPALCVRNALRERDRKALPERFAIPSLPVAVYPVFVPASRSDSPVVHSGSSAVHRSVSAPSEQEKRADAQTDETRTQDITTPGRRQETGGAASVIGGWLLLVDDRTDDETPGEAETWDARAMRAGAIAKMASPALASWREAVRRPDNAATDERVTRAPTVGASAVPPHVLPAVFDAAPLLCCTLDTDGRLLDINSELANLSGYERNNLPETRAIVEDLFPESGDRERAVAFIKEAPPEWISINMRTAGGDTVQTRWACTKLPEDRRLAIGFDDTQREQYERALRAERDRLAMLFRNLPTPVVHGVPDGQRFTVLHVNPAFESVFGVEAETLEGENLHKWIVPPDRQQEAARVNANVVRDSAIHAEVRRLARGREKDFRVHAATRSCEEKGGAEAYAIYTDISEHKAYERKLRRAKEKAEEAARLKAAMLANMSHEVRTPLTAIIGFAEILQNELDAGNARFAKTIRNSSHRLMDTLNSVLDLSKLDAGAYALRRTDVDVLARIRDTVAMMQPMAESGGIALDVTKETSRSLVGSLDAGAIDRIMANLISNALKFTPDGGRVEVRIRYESDASPMAVVEVEDSGVGIDPEFLPHLFEAFRQESDGVRRTHEGTGLGLAITRRLTEILGGTISVESEKGEGTCFTVRLPLSDTTPIQPSSHGGA